MPEYPLPQYPLTECAVAAHQAVKYQLLRVCPPVGRRLQHPQREAAQRYDLVEEVLGLLREVVGKVPGRLEQVLCIRWKASDNVPRHRADALVRCARPPAQAALQGTPVHLSSLETQHSEPDGDVSRALQRLSDSGKVDISHGHSVLLAAARLLLGSRHLMGPEPAAPAVVAVIVASGHGPWLDEAFSSVAAQDYPNLSVLVAEVGTDATLAERVADLLPDAHFARVPAGTGFAEAANQALEMVEGVADVLVCHDDVALEKDAVWHLVEEAYRSNAGLTCPKFVLWDAPDRLLSVGLGADHLGVVHPLVEPGELDQGQRDSVREVFVAPTGAVLVRTDLWRALGGFTAGATGPGGDLDLSWRAQLAGARVVVAPQARARHLEAGPKGFCHSYGAGSPAAKSQATNASEQTRLRALWTCYGPVFVVLVGPVALFFAFAESGWAILHRRPGHEVLAPLRAFALSFSRPRASGLVAGERKG